MIKSSIWIPRIGCAALLGSSCIAAQPNKEGYVALIAPPLNVVQPPTTGEITSRTGNDLRHSSVIAVGGLAQSFRASGSALVVLGGPADQAKNVAVSGRSNTARNAVAISGTFKSRRQ